MKANWLIVRIVFALLLIFALGMLVGRLTAPKESSPIEIVILDEEGEDGDVSRVTRRALARYRDALHLTPEQVSELGPSFLKISRRMEALPRQSEARLKVLEEFHLELKSFLTEKQQKLADEILAKSKAKPRVR